MGIEAEFAFLIIRLLRLTLPHKVFGYKFVVTMCSQGNGWKSYAKIWIYKNLSHDPSPSLNLQRVFVPIYSSFLKIYYLDPPPPLPPHFLASI